MDNPRENCRNQLKETVPEALWMENTEFLTTLKKDLSLHPINNHLLISKLNNGDFDKEKMVSIHLEYREGIVKIFTDALILLQYLAKELEPRFPSGTKMLPRFLITLNTLDEFGFRPGLDINHYYLGNPSHAHYPLFESVLDDYGISSETRESHHGSAATARVKDFLEESNNDYLILTALLATAEFEVMLFSPPLMRNTKKIGLDTSKGYYYHHGASDDIGTDANDDDHADDLWIILAHAIQPRDYERVRTSCLKYCDLWVSFWDQFIE